MKRISLDSRLRGDEVMSATAGVEENTTSVSRPSSVSVKNWMQTEEQPSARKNKQQRTRRKVRALQMRLGAPLETLIADPDARPSRLQVLAYGPESFTEQTLKNPQQVRTFLYEWPVTWLNVDGLGDVEVIKELGDIF